MYAKKKVTQGSQRSYKGRPGSAVDTGQLILEEETVNTPALEDSAGLSQQVYLHLN